MKKLLFIIPLLFGCTRDFTCDAGAPCEAPDVETEGNVNIMLGTECDIRITVDWPDGEKEAEEICDESYNNSISGSDQPISSCSCFKAN